ncbi:hypothetical protein ACWGDX_13475 [Streptomyces sp. NPDC055025]
MTTSEQPALDGTIPAAAPVRRRVDNYETWIDEVRPTFETVARSGRRFTSYEIADEYDLPEPPNPKSHWGTFVHRLAGDGLIEHVGFEETARPTGEHSAVKVWRGTRATRQGRAA